MRKYPKPKSPKSDLSRKALGNYGESLAARWYEAEGYEIVSRQWRCTAGEIDLIVSGPQLLIFCEVKARSSNAYGSPAEAVTWQKQRTIRKVAATYLQTQSTFVPTIRFDVAAVTNGHLEVIENAF